MQATPGSVHDQPPPDRSPTVAEILTALSRALDMTEGQPRGHAARTAMIAVRLGEELGLSLPEREDLYYAALLKDSGCSANSRRIQQTFGGDEITAKRAVKFVDWSRPSQAVGFAVRFAEPGASPVRRLRRLVKMAGPPGQAMDVATSERCSRGAEIAKRLGFNDRVADAVRHLDEHWDGKGAPTHIAGDRIPVLARVLCLAQTLELFASDRGNLAAYRMLEERTGRWFDPQMVRAARAIRTDGPLWTAHAAHLEGQEAPFEAPGDPKLPTAGDVDDICGAFADVVDAKSGFTAEHSSRVTEYAVLVGRRMGLSEERIAVLRRAALLHDIGKLGVSNAILDKPGRLTPEEFERVKHHPRFTYEILGAINGFTRIAEIAAAHHERLDGSGYWRGLDAGHLDLEMRILAVADVYDALTAHRPYRSALTPEDALAIMWKDAGRALDPDCLSAVADAPPVPQPTNACITLA